MSEPKQFVAKNLRGEMRFDVPMSRHTSWRAGGSAKCLYHPADLADLQQFLHDAPLNESMMAVGLGSNLLIRDGGYQGTVLLMHGALDELRMEGDLLYVQAGVPGAKLARYAATQHLSGAEFFAGIPGTLGGMLAMNAGCYGSETWGKVVRVQVMSTRGELIERTADEYEVGYRHANLRSGEQEFFIGAWLKLGSSDSDLVRKDIKSLLEKRSASQPLQQPNAGSVFRNPPNQYAAKLIEECGLKGHQIGDAQVSEKHANFIVNLGNATASDIEKLINEVRATVKTKTGVDLQPEVKIIGEQK